MNKLLHNLLTSWGWYIYTCKLWLLPVNVCFIQSRSCILIWVKDPGDPPPPSPPQPAILLLRPLPHPPLVCWYRSPERFESSPRPPCWTELLNWAETQRPQAWTFFPSFLFHRGSRRCRFRHTAALLHAPRCRPEEEEQRSPHGESPRRLGFGTKAAERK